jgi:hypothetical protein
MKKYLDIAAAALILVCFSFLMAYTLINWALGCGESFPQADGSRIQGECINVLEMFHVEQ